MYYVLIKSKSINSIKNISKFFNSINKKSNLNLNITQKFFQKPNKKKLITILKSPHVNKTAQEQFEFKTISKQFIIKSTNKNFKFLLLLKKLESKLFLDTKINIKLVNNQKFKKHNYKMFNPNNFIINKQFKTLFNILDIYGEFVNKKINK